MRIVSICPSNTEILYYMGLGDLVVGLDDHSDWPPEWQHLPRVGPDLTIDMEKVQALAPNLVIASLSVPGMEKNIDELVRLGIPHIVLNPSKIDDIPEDIRLVGRATGYEERAEQLARDFSEKIAMFRQATAQVTNRPKLFWEWWPNPIYTPGRDNWLTDVSEIAGAVNVFADYETDNVKATREMVSERDPDHICVVWCGIELKRIKPSMITDREEWQEMTAIVKGQVHLLEEGLYCRPSPRILEGLEKLIGILHPDIKL
ncbi:cobalamin-binding protein [Brevibacillus dissolubilis]|uniref:cobalamin-binding protein n=1 Tax=Brevibacillus dissolubilis TaxID=1844116 RepID=UPI001117A735|nr:cobalamin-binding protein [Brevibacillus dissolubilis]